MPEIGLSEPQAGAGVEKATPKKSKKPHEHFLTDLGFCILGIMNNFSYIIGISAAVDLVEEAFPKSIVLLCDIGPGFILSFIYPQVQEYLELKWIAPVISLFGVLGYVLAALSEKYGKLLGLFGVVCFSLQIGNEGPSLSHSANFLPDASAMFCVGMGIAGLLGSGGYALLTETLSIPYQIILYCFSPLPLLLNLGAWLTYVKPSYKRLLEAIAVEESNLAVTLSVSATTDLTEDPDVVESIEDNSSTKKVINHDFTSFKDKMQALKHNALCLLSLWTVYVWYYSTTTGVNPTIFFGNDKKLFYKYAAFAIRTGNLLGRCSVLFMQIPYWSLAVFSAVALLIFVFFIFQSAFRFVKSVWIMWCVCPFLGLASGVIYSHTMNWIYMRNEHANPRAYAMGTAGMLTNLGVVFSTFIGTGLEIGLKKLFPSDWS